MVPLTFSALTDPDDGISALRRNLASFRSILAPPIGPTAISLGDATLRAELTKARAPNICILYGGSVKAANAAALFAMTDVDGGLVGGASLDADEFLAIARA